MLNRYGVQKAIEEWRDEQIASGAADHGYLVALLDEELLKSLADHLMWKIRENA